MDLSPGPNFFSTSLRYDGFHKTVDRFEKMTPEQLLRCIGTDLGRDVVTRQALVNLNLSREAIAKAEEFHAQGLTARAEVWRRKSRHYRQMALNALRVYIAAIYKFRPKRKRAHHHLDDDQVIARVRKIVEEQDYITGGRLFKAVFGHSASVTDFDRERKRQLRSALNLLESEGFLIAKDGENMGQKCLRVQKLISQPVQMVVSVYELAEQKKGDRNVTFPVHKGKGKVTQIVDYRTTEYDIMARE